MNWGNSQNQHSNFSEKKHYQVVVESQEKANELVLKNPMNLKFCPFRFRTQELCDWALRRNPLCVGYIPIEKLTQEHCDWAVKQNYMAHKFVNVAFKTEEMLFYVVSLAPLEIFNMPTNLVSMRMIKKALSLNGSIYSNLPNSLKTKELEDIAMKADVSPYKRQIFVNPYVVNKGFG